MTKKFLADVHLGKLARLLRLLGFDTFYRNNCTNNQLVQLSIHENRVLLSRKPSWLKNTAIESLIIKNEDSLLQLKQVIDHFQLKGQLHPFSRCIVCNGILQPVTKESISHLLKKNTGEYFHQFWQCHQCKRIYWTGSHYERMLKTIESIVS